MDFVQGEEIQGVASLLLRWFDQHGRKLPWRDTHQPYQIWIAEVILQQTRIEQGIGYYYRFLDRFPNVESLAAATEDEVLKYWEGLGYYSRARNLHAAGKTLHHDMKGIFPENHQELLKLKGIGPYTARAISSFAFGEPVGVLDGNVLRVVSRVLGTEAPINKPQNRTKFQQVVDSWVADYPSRDFNHAMMDLGATLCTPTKPGCMVCPLIGVCQAYQKGLTGRIPVKEKKLK
ncbi:MAG: A/G-specific adenine glycosylase, partial [Bacteroidota bacterium]